MPFPFLSFCDLGPRHLQVCWGGKVSSAAFDAHPTLGLHMSHGNSQTVSAVTAPTALADFSCGRASSIHILSLPVLGHAEGEG